MVIYMKKIILGTIIGAASIGSTFAACTYNFDATASQIDQIHPSVQRFPNVSNQKVGFNIVADTGTKSYVAYSSAYAANTISGNTAGDISTPSSGVFAYEYKFKVPTNLLASNEGLAFFPILAVSTYNSYQGDSLAIVYTNNVSTNPNKNEFKIYKNFSGGGYALPVATTSSGYQNIGFYVNQNTNQVGVIFNGVNYGYVIPFQSGFNKFLFANAGAQYQFANNSSSLGQEVSVELITDHTKLQNTYPTGTTDICGNTI